MKLNKYIWLAALPMIFTACQEDMLVENSSKQGITTLSATMGNDADSRAQIKLGTYPGTFMWNEGDAFTLFETKENVIESKEFSIDTEYSDENPSAGANFSISEGNPLTVGNSFNAIYPSINNQDASIYRGSDKTTNVNYISMTITQPQYNMTTLEGETEADKIDNFWKTYFKNNLFMKADGDVTSNTKVNFEHLCGLVRVSYTNNKSQSVTIKEIRLNGHWQKQIYLDETTFERLSMQPKLKPLSFFSDGFNLHVAPYETKDFYFLFFPLETSDYEKFSGIEIDYIPDGNANDYVTYRTPSTYGGKGFVAPIFEAGKTYWFKITETGGNEELPYSLVWTADLQGGGNSGNQPGGDVIEPDEVTKQFLKDLENTELTEVTLTKPITLVGNVDLRGKTVTLSNSFFTENSNVSAAINYDGTRQIKISNGTIKGSTTVANKYLLQIGSTNAPWVSLSGVDIVAEGKLNAVSVIDANVRPQSGTTINTQDGSAIELFAKRERVMLEIIGATINNAVKFSLSNTNGVESKVFIDGEAKINGVLTVNGIAPFIIYNYSNVTLPESWEPYVNNASIPEGKPVSSLEELLAAIENPDVSSIYLKETIDLNVPLTINRDFTLNLNNFGIHLAANFEWDGVDAAITNTSGKLTVKNGYMKPVTGSGDENQYLDKALFKTTSELLFEKASLSTGILKDAVLVVDGKCNVNESTIINAYRYALNIKANTFCDVDIWTGVVTGDVNLELNSETYTKKCWFGCGPDTKVTGSLNIVGTYGENASGYVLERHVNADLQGEGWDKMKVVE